MYEPLHRHRPRHRWTNGDLAARVAEDLGLPPDDEQRWILDTTFAETAPDRPASFEVGVISPRQNIKALAWDTPILTRHRGFVPMVEVAVNDEVFHPCGHPTRVVAISQLMFGDCYRVTTTDGRSVIADADHLWAVTDKRRERSVGSLGDRRRWFEQRVLTTKEMLSAGLSRYATGGRTSVTDGKTYATNEYRFQLPEQRAIQCPEVDLPLDPYLLGAWLGDGTTTAGVLTSSAADVAHWVEQFTRGGFVPTVNLHPDRAASIGITTAPGPGRQARSFAGHLRRAGVFGDKHVPSIYLTAGPRQREALLQGLLDTDGTVDTRRGQVSFCSTSRRLADAVLFLARSLGWRPTIYTGGRAKLNGRDCGPKYSVQFTPVLTEEYRPFRLARKLARLHAADGGKGRLTLSIRSIESVQPVPVLCIKVESPDGLYLAGRDLIPTHNTSSFGVAAIADLFVFGVERHLWTAHHGDTLKGTFNDFRAWIKSNPEYDEQVTFYEGHQDMSIVHKETGNTIDFQSRTGKAGRGLTGVKRITVDEALYLEPKHVGAIYPTMLTRPGAQVRIASSAGLEISEQLRRIRDRGRAGKDARMAWVEYGADRKPCLSADCTHAVGTTGCALDDRDLWWQANPALWSGRITEAALEDQRAALPPEEFMREFLSWWDDPVSGGGVIDMALWNALRSDSPESDPEAFGLDMTWDREWADIGWYADGYVDLHQHRKGSGWVVAECVELQEQYPDAAIWTDPKGPAATLIEPLREAGVRVQECSGDDYRKACGDFHDAVTLSGLRHSDHPALDAAVFGAVVTGGTGGWVWDRKKGAVISPLVAVTFARFGASRVREFWGAVG